MTPTKGPDAYYYGYGYSYEKTNKRGRLDLVTPTARGTRRRENGVPAAVGKPVDPRD